MKYIAKFYVEIISIYDEMYRVSESNEICHFSKSDKQEIQSQTLSGVILGCFK